MKRILLILLAWPMMLSAQEAVTSDTTWTDATHGVIKKTYYDEQSTITSVEEYTLTVDESTGKMRSRIDVETCFYPDGKTKEEVQLGYEPTKTGEKRTYVRKCFSEEGRLWYEEKHDGSKTRTAYYNEKGKVDRHPKETIEPYLTLPAFPGGQEALIAYLNRTVKYPRIAQENGIQGRVLIRFVVAKDGSIEEAKVVRSGGDPSLDKEALRVIKSMPRWIPGKKRGNPIRVQYHVPVNFQLP